MDQNLRGLFDRALDDEPAPPTGEIARTAMAAGARLRLRRRVLGGAAVSLSLAVAGAGALHLAAPPPTAPPRITAAAPGASCAATASSVSIFLTADVIDTQRTALDKALGEDDRVRTHRYENQQQAFEKFRVLWRDDPDFVGSVTADSLPESFRVELVRPSEYPAFRASLDRFGGVQDIVADTCP